MNQNPGYKSGDWKAICDSCGFEFMASELQLRWDGFRVCKKDWETRNPQDFLRSVPEKITPAWTRSKDGSEWLGAGYVLAGPTTRHSQEEIIYCDTITAGTVTVDMGSASATFALFLPRIQVCKVGTLTGSVIITATGLASVTLTDFQSAVYTTNGTTWSLFQILR